MDEETGNWYIVKVFIPDTMGGSTTTFNRFAKSAGAAMDSVAEDNPDVTVISAREEA